MIKRLVVGALVTSCGSAPPPPAAPATAASVEKFEMRTYWLVMLRRGPAWTA